MNNLASRVGAMLALLAFRRVALLFASAAGAALAGLLILLAPPPWRSAADVEFTAVNASDPTRTDLGAVIGDALVENQGVMALSHPVLTRAASDLQGAWPGADVTALQRTITARRLPRTLVWRISATASDREGAAARANAVAGAWIAEHHAERVRAAQTAAAAIRARLPDLERNLREAENAAADWRRRHALAPEGDSGPSMEDRQFTRLNEELASVRAAIIAARARLQRITDDAGADDLATPAAQEAQQTLAALARRDAELSTRYGPQHPDRIAVKAHLAAATRALNAERDRQRRRVEGELKEGEQREHGLRRELAQRTASGPGPAASAAGHSIRLNELERQAEAARAAYETALKRLKLLEIADALGGPAPRVMSAATPGTATRSLSPVEIVMAGGVLGLASGCALLLWRVRLRDPCLATEQLARDVGLSRAFAAPRLDRDARKARGHVVEPATVVALRPHHPFPEAFRRLARALDAQPAPPAHAPDRILARGRIIVIASAATGEGRTTTAIALGLTLAASGRRVALIDADASRAGLSAYFGLRAEPGMAELLAGELGFSDVSARRHNLTVIPAGGGPLDAAATIIATRSRDALHRFAMVFDDVVVDAPPDADGGGALLAACDAAVILARWGVTPRARVCDLARHAAAQGKLGAVMLTFVPQRRPYMAPSLAAFGAPAQLEAGRHG